MAKVTGQEAGEGGEQAPWDPGTEFNSRHAGQGSEATECPSPRDPTLLCQWLNM